MAPQEANPVISKKHSQSTNVRQWRNVRQPHDPDRIRKSTQNNDASRERRSGTATRKAIVESDLHQMDLLILVEDERQACR